MADDTKTPKQGEGTAESPGISRRGFLAGAAGGLTGVALSGTLGGVPALAASTRATSPGLGTYKYWYLELNGQVAGLLHSVLGGDAVAQVVEEPRDPDGVVRKHLGELTYRDIVLQVGPTMSPAFYNWVSTFFNHTAVQASGALIGIDFEGKIKRRVEFSNAVIREVRFPTLSGGSDDPVFLTVTIAPQFTQRVPATGVPPGIGTKAKRWISGNFRAAFGSLPGTKISKIDSFSARQPTTEGTGRGLMFLNVDFTDLGVTLTESPVWNQFYESFVIQGNNSQEDEIATGSIKLLGPDLTSVLATIELKQIGIFSLGFDGAEPGSGTRMKAGLYVEDVRFHVSAAAAP